MHHKYSPSKLASLEACPRFENSLSDSEASITGTRIHKAIELGKIEMLADEQERELAMRCALEAQREIDRGQYSTVANEYMLESSINHGTGDVVAWSDTEGLILDYKTGAVEVAQPEDNLQIWNYAYNLFQMKPQLRKIRGVISQPKVWTEAKSHDFLREDCGKIKARIDAVTERADDPNAPYCPGDVCQWCGAKAKCPALSGMAVKVTYASLGLPEPSSYFLEAARSAEDVAKLQTVASILADWCDQAKKAAAAFASESGAEIPGYTLVQRPGNRKVESPMAVAIYAKEHGLSLEQVLESCTQVSAKKFAELVYDLTGLDAQSVLDELESSGIVSRGDAVIYLRKKGKKTDVERLKEIV